MCFKKLISSVIVLSVLSANINVLSQASIELDNRYKTLEGEFVTMNNSVKGYLHDIELFGNTIQDQDNLTNIQSVGDLYVNKQGEPILDKNNKEQYKINIITHGKNLFNAKARDNVYGKYLDENGDLISSSQQYLTTGFIHVKPNTTYYKSGNIDGDVTFFYDKDKNIIGEKVSVINGIIETPSNAYYLRTNSRIDSLNTLQIEEGSIKTEYMKYIENEITILLPCQLQSIGDTKDRLYWDIAKNKYVIEKNVEEKIFTEKDSWILSPYGNENFLRVYSTTPTSKTFTATSKDTTISNLFKGDMYDNNKPIDERTFIYSADIHFTILKERLSTADLNGFKAWLMENPITTYYPLRSSKYVDTNIVEKIKIPVYEGQTSVYAVLENKTTSILRATFDNLVDVAKEVAENAILDKNLMNISLARMYINMLPESLYKDQLQTQLNEIFSEDMVLDRLSSTANLDVYIQSENILMMSLDTNTVTFEDYSGVEELEIKDAIGISINSSLPYQLNAYIVGDIVNKDKDKTLDLDVFNVKESSTEEYKQFSNTNTKLVLLDNVDKGNNIIHNIDLKLSGNKAHDADVYKTTIKFEAEQK